MTAKHTQGPWKIGTPGPNGCYTVGTEGGLMVAMVAHSANHLAECEQAIGDARLISAAPELLEALIECIECEFATTDKDALAKAKAAISKATGEAA